MARRPRDYAAEYARRKALHGGDVTKARGHGSRSEERLERKARNFLKNTDLYDTHTVRDIKDLAAEFGQEEIEKALDLQNRAREAYYKGDMILAHDIWEDRNPDLPDWMGFYHGAFSA